MGNQTVRGVLKTATLAVIIEGLALAAMRAGRPGIGLGLLVLLPFVCGYSTAAWVPARRTTVSCLAISLLLSLSALLATGPGGIACSIMLLPLVGVAVSIGAIGHAWAQGPHWRFLGSAGKTVCLIVLGAGLALTVARPGGRNLATGEQREVISTETVVAAPPARAWDLVARMEHIDGPRPLLLQVGLPVPLRCTLTKAAVGGVRTCHFDQGIIQQRVTRWQKPYHMGLLVQRSTLPGGRWFHYLNAGYELREVPEGTRVTRYSTVATRLYPRWYWRPLERWGVGSEHAYVLANLRRSAESR